MTRSRRPTSSKRSETVSADLVFPLPFLPPFDWDFALRHLSSRVVPGVETVSDGCYSRVAAFNGDVGLVTVALDPAAPQLLVTVAATPASVPASPVAPTT